MAKSLLYLLFKHHFLPTKSIGHLIAGGHEGLPAHLSAVLNPTVCLSQTYPYPHLTLTSQSFGSAVGLSPYYSKLYISEHIFFRGGFRIFQNLEGREGIASTLALQNQWCMPTKCCNLRQLVETLLKTIKQIKSM